MRCAACATDNIAEASQCARCGAKLARRARRRLSVEESDRLLTSFLIPHGNHPARRSYYCGIIGMIPVLGLVLGPAAILFGLLGVRQAQADPQQGGLAHAIAGTVLGAAELLTNAAGLALICWGWHSLSAPG
ncbi:MAG: hypothetical protein ACK4RK_06020 [Gemmataceae bacterium]